MLANPDEHIANLNSLEGLIKAMTQPNFDLICDLQLTDEQLEEVQGNSSFAPDSDGCTGSVLWSVLVCCW